MCGAKINNQDEVDEMTESESWDTITWESLEGCLQNRDFIRGQFQQHKFEYGDDLYDYIDPQKEEPE